MTPSGTSISRAAATALVMSATSAMAAAPAQMNAAEILREIERLSVVGNVLYVAAHPDDENTRLLSWLVNDQKVRAGYFSFTRGEGGQNLIGPEQAPLLGLIRTQELLAARGIDRAEQLFGRERDFGYSKTPEETLAVWGKDEALADVVWAIRRFQPDVIVTRFSPEDRATHGHHTASAMLALEAFRAAADPAAFPEQLKLAPAWKARRLVWNKGVFGQAKPGELDGFVKMDIGAFDPLLGASYGELAAKGRSMHKSQGFGALPQRGPVLEYFRVLAGEPIQASFLEGVDLSWGRVPGSGKLRDLLARARALFDPRDPAASIPVLVDAALALDALPDSPFKAQKRADLENVIAACAGLFADAVAADPTVVPGGELKLTVTALNRGRASLSLRSVRVLGEEIQVGKALEQNQPWSLEKALRVPGDAPFSNPYWLREEPSPGRWTVHDQALIGLAEDPPPFSVDLTLIVNNRTLTVTRPIAYVWLDPVAGERRRPLEVLPPVTLNAREPLLAFPDGADKDLRVTVRASRGPESGTVQPQPPAGFTVEPTSLRFSLAESHAEQELVFKVRPPAKLADESASASGTLQLTATLARQGAPPVDRALVRVEYPHIPSQTLAPLAQVKLVRFEMKRALSKVGYVPGAGDEVPQALRQVGYEVSVLSDEALAAQPLDRFQAIVIGVRAFNTDTRLQPLHQRLMDYVQRGGTLVVQYSTQNRISKLAGQIGPWPFNISQDRVTDETAAVERLAPDHRLLRAPNRIADHDFDGWVQERGLYFADTWDEHYQPVLAMHDPGEPPRKGGLLVARFGKGVFIYTGLAFFRQLPAGVPGAYRLFANLLSHE
jgi:LmbE family N-acetylglucosaminyl deacetylase